jgi:GNAT superfamily N-acetyltransferase
LREASHHPGMTRTLALRTARPSDLPAVDLLLSRSFPQLLARDYPPSVMVTAVPRMTRARPELLASGRYYVVEDNGGRLVGAGGYSLSAAASARAGPVAHVRHVAVDPAATRRGIGAAILRRAMTQALDEGATGFECLSTRTAVPFYAAMGFVTVGPAEVALAADIVFPAVLMRRPPTAPA